MFRTCNAAVSTRGVPTLQRRCMFAAACGQRAGRKYHSGLCADIHAAFKALTPQRAPGLGMPRCRRFGNLQKLMALESHAGLERIQTALDLAKFHHHPEAKVSSNTLAVQQSASCKPEMKHASAERTFDDSPPADFGQQARPGSGHGIAAACVDRGQVTVMLETHRRRISVDSCGHDKASPPACCAACLAATGTASNCCRAAGLCSRAFAMPRHRDENASENLGLWMLLCQVSHLWAVRRHRLQAQA